jgi:hypothetical protein
MADCPRISICRFYKQYLAQNPAMAENLRSRYCLSNYLACARYSVARGLGSDHVPDTLHPNQHAEARRMLGSS